MNFCAKTCDIKREQSSKSKMEWKLQNYKRRTKKESLKEYSKRDQMEEGQKRD